MTKNLTMTTETRLKIAKEAAKIMVEQMVSDYQTAKKKAAERLGADKRKGLPTNAEVDAEVRAYQALFKASTQPQQLLALRKAALSAMRFLASFNPRLVGSVLDGSADSHSVVQIHIVADAPESVHIFLHDAQIPFEMSEASVSFQAGKKVMVPSVLFYAGETPFEVICFSLDGPRQPPLSAIDGKSIQRLSVQQLTKLIEQVEAHLTPKPD